MGQPKLSSVPDNFEETMQPATAAEAEAPVEALQSIGLEQPASAETEEKTDITAVTKLPKAPKAAKGAKAMEDLGYPEPARSSGNKLSLIGIVIATLLGGGSLGFEYWLFKTNAMEMDQLIKATVRKELDADAKKSKLQKQVNDALAAEDKSVKDAISAVKAEVTTNVSRDLNLMKERIDTLEKQQATHPAKKGGAKRKR